MAIQTRGDQSQFLVTRGAIPVELVVEKVLAYKDIDRVCKKYNLTSDEVFECVDFWADCHLPNCDSFIQIENQGSLEELEIVADKISNDLWYNIISYAHMFYPQETDMNKLCRNGLRLIVLECYVDIYNDTKACTHSDLHNIVFKAAIEAVGTPYDTERVLELLGVNEYLQQVERIKTFEN